MLAKSLLAMAVAAALPLRMAEDATTLLDLDSILGQSIDDVDTAPEFVTPPDGAYLLTIADAKLETYKVTLKEGDNAGKEEERTRIKIFYQVVQTNKLVSDEESPVPAGSLFTEQFMTNPQGLSYFKRQSKNVLGEETIKGTTIKEILQELPNNHTFNADVRVKTDKVGDKVYRNVQVRIHQGDPLAAGEAKA